MSPQQPLQPISVPDGSIFHLVSLSVPSGTLMTWLFYVVALYWLFCTVVAVYHWLAYSHGSIFAIPAIALHGFVSFMLLSYIVSGLL